VGGGMIPADGATSSLPLGGHTVVVAHAHDVLASAGGDGVF